MYNPVRNSTTANPQGCSHSFIRAGHSSSSSAHSSRVVGSGQQRCASHSPEGYCCCTSLRWFVLIAFSVSFLSGYNRVPAPRVHTFIRDGFTAVSCNYGSKHKSSKAAALSYERRRDTPCPHHSETQRPAHQSTAVQTKLTATPV